MAFRSTTTTTTIRTRTLVPANAFYYDTGLANSAKHNIFKRALVPGGKATYQKQRMKRIDKIYDAICSMDNLRAADCIAQRGKTRQHGVQRHNANREQRLQELREILLTKSFRTSEYNTFKIYEPKERLVYSLPYYPDRIVHHAIMRVLEPVFNAMFTADTYSCIKDRGIHSAARKLRYALKDRANTAYCLKLDIQKFYPSIDHDVLKSLLRRKIKDADALCLLDGIIESAPGLPIGNYLSQHLANFYLTYFDHWLKETVGVKYYFRYCDDLVLLSGNKPYLHQTLGDVRTYLSDNLKLQIKSNYQVFPVAVRGIDFLGYVFYPTHMLIRKSIKQNCARKLGRGASPAIIASYAGWLKHADAKNLSKKLFTNAA